MTTQLLFRDDAYLKTATARVIAVGERGIELDRTIFYPLGGGQPGDTGALIRHNLPSVRVGANWYRPHRRAGSPTRS